MGVSLICVGVRQQYGCFDTHTSIQFSTYETNISKKGVGKFSKNLHFWNHQGVSFRVVCIVCFEPSDPFQRTVSGATGDLESSSMASLSVNSKNAVTDPLKFNEFFFLWPLGDKLIMIGQKLFNLGEGLLPAASSLSLPLIG